MKILVCSDLTPRSESAIDRALQIAGGSGEVHVVHVVDEDLPPEIRKMAVDAGTARLNEALKARSVPDGCRLTSDVLPGRSHRTLTNIATTRHFDLIVFGTHEPYSGAYRGPGATIERVLKSTHIPVLVVKQPVQGPYRQVIVGVDFSAHSRAAIRLAPRFAPEAETHLVHAYLNYHHAGGHPADASDSDRGQLRILERMLIDEIEPPFAPDVVIDQDHPVGLIRDQVAEKQADLVIIGTSGRTGLARVLLGSVAEDLLADPPCDIMAVRAV